MPIRVNNYGEFHNQGLIEVVCNTIGSSLLVLNIQLELLHVCGPFLMVVIL
jgi:hypothetical protein